ncbi:discoidin domain-containing protein [Paenibacillus sp. S150]|uniref:galactose-binding domain-containing protein n=1 Tax=Paenibacillus sp. S150 TaxID=2749826 RepID=UPI001C58B533|nr:discoidin domain-containing protein [Paenibacillus sp. S150]MBW4082279.1 discoidin domain-containing protein [Paenibacillus sp. S150]
MYPRSDFHARKGNRIAAMVLSLAMLLSLGASFGASPAHAAASQLLSLRKAVLASSAEGDNTTERAVDGNISSRWASVWQMDPQWIYVDLGAAANINRVYLSWEGAYAKAYKVQVSSDANTWNDIYSTTAGTGGISDLTNLAGTGRYVRVYCTQRALADYGYSLYEFQVYGEFTTPQPPPPVNIAVNKAVLASTWEVPSWSTDPGIVAAVKVNDGDYTTRWSSESWDPQWISVDLGSTHTIGTVILNWEAAYGKSYDIQVSSDGTNWNTVYRQLYGRGGVETIKVKADGRYVRMYGFARGTGNGYSLYELEVYDFVTGDPVPAVHIPDKPVPQIVNVGAGSYKTNDITTTTPTYPEYKTANVTGPLPSGGWWQSILIKRLSDGLVSLPLRTQYTDQGLSVMNPGAGYMSADGNTVSTAGAPDFYLMAGNIDPLNMSSKVDGYGDYSVRAVLSDDSTYKMKTTLVKGSPYFYNEFTDPSSPFLVLNGSSTRFFNDSNGTILAADGASVTADHIGVEVVNTDSGGNSRTRSYGLFAPAGSIFKRTGGKLTIQLGSQEQYLSVATLPANGDLNYYYLHAYAFVTDTRANYNVQDETGTVTTTYNSTVQLKRSGFPADSLMALLPNQWKSLASGTSLTAHTYPSIRGIMKVHEGSTFSTENKFTGIIPQFAEPTGSSSYNKADAISYLNTMNDMLENNYMWDDPYWEGKNLQPLAQGILIADQLGETAIRDKALSILKKILTDWYTYSGGWPDDYPYYLYYTPEWGAMQGDGGDHGMAKWMSDHHYVWGYYIYASAILGTYDQDFVNSYGGIVEHLIRDVGNPSRTDSMYPFMRAFDPYEGVSWAGGYGDSYDGNNQEATSEALFAYAGEYLWGVLTNNNAYRDAGMWVYAVETNSVMQYWFNYDQDNWLPGYRHGVVGQLFGSKNFYGTYFAADANNIYGIQWLPTAPYMTYLGLRPDAAARTYNAFKTDKGGPETGWYHIIWPFEALSNPQDALSKWDPVKIANDDNNGKKEWANTYWFLHAMDAFGTRTTDIWSSNWSTYQMFKKNGTYTANIWNPTDETKYVVFRNAGGDIVGTITVPAKKTVAGNPVNGIQPPNSDEKAAAPVFSPAGGTYTSAQLVSISSATAGATIRYTTDGSEPTAASASYTAPVNVAQSMTLKAKAFKELLQDSTTSSAAYIINAASQVAQPVITPATGNYTEAQNVTITSGTQGASIRYTTDGSTPTASTGTLYSASFTVPVTTTVKAIAYKSGMTDSAVAVSVLTISADSTNLALNKTASASTSLGGNTAAAAFDGSASTRWESASSDPQWIQTDLGSAYSVTGVKLNWETAAGKDYKIQVSADNADWSDAFTRTGGTGGIETLAFTTPVTARYVRLSGTARTTGYGYSLWEFEVYGTAVANQAAAPVFSPAGGTYASAQSVTLTSATAGATIKYTTDGTAPASDSATYSSPLTVSSTGTLKAIAVKAGMSDSDVASSTYTINLPSGNAVPGKIEAESYTAMNGIQTEACSEGTLNVSYTDGGDWMDYTVNVAQAGTYTVEFRVASPYDNTRLQLMKDTAVLAAVTVPNTGSFQTWQTATATVTLSAGTQTLRVYSVTNGWNFNYMDFK